VTRPATGAPNASVLSAAGIPVGQIFGRHGLPWRHGPAGGPTTPRCAGGSRRCMPSTAGMISVPAVATNKIRINISSAIAPRFLPNVAPGAGVSGVGTAGHGGRAGLAAHDHPYQLGDEPAHKSRV
jgi:hypothetical protein